MKKKLLKIFGMRSEEWNRALLLLIFNFFAGLAIIITETTADTLFLSRFNGNLFGFEKAAALPIIYIASAVFVTLLGTLRYNISQFFSESKILSGSQFVLIIGLLIFYLCIKNTAFLYIFPILLIWYEFTYTILIINGDITGNTVFNVREAKRTFAFISGGYLIADIIGGFGISILTEYLTDITDLLLIALVSLLISYIIFIVIVKKYKESFNEPDDKTAPDEEEETESILKIHYIYYAGLFIVSLCLLFYFIDYQFKKALITFFTESTGKVNEIRLASFIALLTGSLNIIKLILIFFVANRTIKKVGIFITLLFAPILLVITGIFTKILPMQYFFICIVAMRCVEDLFRDTFNDTNIPLLFQCLKEKIKAKAYDFVVGIVDPLSAGIAGLLLILMFKIFNSSNEYLMIYPIIIVSILLIFIIWLLRKEYVNNFIKLTENKKKDLPDFNIFNPSLIKIFYNYLKSKDPENILFSIQLLKKIKPLKLSKKLRPLIKHPDDRVKVKTIETLIELNDNVSISEIEELFMSREHVSEKVFSISIEAVAAYMTEEAIEYVKPLLNDESENVKIAACAALLAWCGIEGISVALPVLRSYLESSDYKNRILASKIIEKARMGSLRKPILNLLFDSHVEVRISAIKLIANLKIKYLYNNLIKSLGDENVSKHASRMIIKLGEDILSNINQLLAEDSIYAEIKIKLVKTLGKINSTQASIILLKYCFIKNVTLRHEILKNIFYLKELPKKLPLQQFKELFFKECEYYLHLLNVKTILNSQTKFDFLDSILFGESEKSLKRIIFILSLFYNRQIINGVYYSFEKGGQGRINSLELMDNSIQKPFKEFILILFDNYKETEKLNFLKHRFNIESYSKEEIINNILSENSNYFYSDEIKLAIIYTLGLLKEKTQIENILKYAKSNFFIFRETCFYALKDICPEKIQDWKKNLNVKTDKDLLLSIDDFIRGGRLMLSTVERIFFLKKVPIFSSLENELLIELALRFKEKTYQSDEIIFNKDDLGKSMYIILSGVVNIEINNNVIAKLESGQCFGEMAVLDMEPRSATAKVKESAVLLSIGEHELFDIINKESDVARGIIKVVTRRLRAANEKIQDLNKIKKA